MCDRLGGAAGLKQFRERLHAHRLKLILDFVPNHLGLDHAWVRERPDLFVQGSPRAPGTFSEKTVDGRRWLAHGRDPYFPPWADTVQLDYRQPATHVAMRHQLHAVAELCDGVRCDMAMLVTNEVFARTWADFPCRVPQPPVEEFWKETIASVRRISPEFLFLAEVYWNLEAHLQSLGFDFTYHKTVYDHLVARRYPPLQQHLLAASPSFLQASAHFLENHDEPRIASLLQPAEHRAAALLTLALPGMKILHEGQLSGWVKKAGIHFARRLVEPGQAEVSSFYESLLRILPTTALGRGKAVVLRPQEALPGNTTAENTVAVLWREDGLVFEFDLAVVNLAPHPSQCRLQWKMEGTPKQSWKIRNLLGREPILFPESEQQGPTICLDLPAHAAWILHGEPVP